MAITPGSLGDAGDFIEQSAGAADAGKGVKLGPTGKLHSSFSALKGCKAIQNAAQTIGFNGVVTFQAEEFDTDNMHENVTNPTRITIPEAGIWAVGGGYQTGSNFDLLGYIRLNGATALAVNQHDNGLGLVGVYGLSVDTIRTFAAGDYIELVTVTGSAGAATTGDERAYMYAYKIG